MTNASSDDPPPEPEDWLPDLIRMADHGHQFKPYIDAVYAVFRQDFVTTQPQFLGRWVRCRRDPIYDGKEAGFWHCTSEGQTEEEREPDFRRCERIGWVRAIIEHAEKPGVDVWENERNGEKRTLLWCREEFLIVLALRVRQRDGFRYYQLMTAYCTEEEHRKRKLRRERDEYRQKGSGNV